MKKFLAKLGLFITINLMLVSVMPTAWAAGTCTIAGLKEALAKTPDCISATEAGTTFISIIEEPLIEIKPEEIDKNFRAETCYRQTVSCKTDGTNGQILRNSRLVKGTKAGPGEKEGVEEAPVAGCIPGENAGMTTTCKEVTVIFSDGGTVMISGYVAMIYRWAAPIVGMICVLVIVVSGLQLSFSAGDSGAVDSARKRIIQSLSGLAVLFLSSVILYTVNPNFFIAP